MHKCIKLLKGAIMKKFRHVGGGAL